MQARWVTAGLCGAIATLVTFVAASLLVAMLSASGQINTAARGIHGSRSAVGLLVVGTIMLMWAGGVFTTRMIVARRDRITLGYGRLAVAGLAIALVCSVTGAFGFPLFLAGWVVAARTVRAVRGDQLNDHTAPNPQPAENPPPAG